MKVVFVNAPVVRSENSKPENDFKLEGFIFEEKYKKVPGFTKAFNFLHDKVNLGGTMRYGVRAGSRWPFSLSTPGDYAPYPFFMGYSAALLQKNGFEVDLIDAVAQKLYDYNKFFEILKSKKPDIVVVECSTPTVDIDLWIAKKISAFAKVALAGPHLSKDAVKLQKENPHVTFFLKGEYIATSLKMAQTLTPGIYESEVVKDVDSIPFPYRNIEGWQNYYDPSMPTQKPMLQLYSAKGCPFKCTFCSWPQTMYGGNVALRKPEKIAQEIKEAVAAQKYKSIFFDDDTFNLGTERISELCDHLKEIGLPWTMMGRLDVSPAWLYDKMVDSGCVGMRFGIETFDLEVLKNVKKGIEKKDFRGTLEHITKTHPQLMIHLTMMKEMPGQTQEIHEQDMKILHDLGYEPTDKPGHNFHRSYQLSNCAPFPGTEMYATLAAKFGEAKLENFLSYDGGRETVMKALNELPKEQ